MSPTLCQQSARLSITFRPCHPETESKDLNHTDATLCDERSFRITVHFFDEHETEQCPVSSSEATEYDSPAHKCRISERN
jgi:hypothetical protein